MIDPSLGLTLWQVLIGSVVLAACIGKMRTAGIAALVLLNWYICTHVVRTDIAGKVYWNWPAWALTDFAIGACVAFIATNRAALLIAWAYIAELACHFAFGMSEVMRGPATYETTLAYWTCTHWAAWLQAWLLVIWIGRDGLQMVGAALDRDSRRHACGADGGEVAALGVAEAKTKEGLGS